MRKYLIAACLAAASATPAIAADDPMAGFYGNTIVSTGGSATLRTHYRADHTFDFTGSMMFVSRTFKGTWALDGKGGLCRTYEGKPPPDTPNPNCVPLVPRKVGDVWKSKDNARTFTLKAGIE
jgi:opacity protein-like surface antigen